jgi:hypothetical protein
VNRLRRDGKLIVFFFEDADHCFTQRVPRRTLVQVISEYLCQRYGSAGA